MIDEIEARFRRARAWHEAKGKNEGARIFSEMVAWIVEHGPALKAGLTDRPRPGSSAGTTS